VAPTTSTGEIWTDAHGFAVVALPVDVDPEIDIEIRALADGVIAALTREPERRRFTITTSEPHVKVAWRVTSRRLREPRQQRRPIAQAEHAPDLRGEHVDQHS